MVDNDFRALLKRCERETYGFPSNKSVYDVEGRELRVWSYDGKLLPPFGDKGPKQMKDLQLRDDDIILCGYPKTGCHWAWEMVAMRQAQLSNSGKLEAFLELGPFQLIEGSPSPRILNMHMWFDYLPKKISDKKTKIILTVRNPKDTTVSLYNHHLAYKDVLQYDGHFKDWFQLYMDGQGQEVISLILRKLCDGNSTHTAQLSPMSSRLRHLLRLLQRFPNHVIKSQPVNPILVANFEDMKEDLPREIRKISEFLQITLDDHLVDDIARIAGFDVMKAAYKTNNLLSRDLIRKGVLGDWKNWFTVAQSEMVDEAMKALQGTLFHKPRYTL